MIYEYEASEMNDLLFVCPESLILPITPQHMKT